MAAEPPKYILNCVNDNVADERQSSLRNLIDVLLSFWRWRKKKGFAIYSLAPTTISYLWNPECVAPSIHLNCLSLLSQWDERELFTNYFNWKQKNIHQDCCVELNESSFMTNRMPIGMRICAVQFGENIIIYRNIYWPMKITFSTRCTISLNILCAQRFDAVCVVLQCIPSHRIESKT